jgi:hypothetical protein
MLIKILKIFFLLVIGVPAAIALWIWFTPATSETLPLLQSGDLVFQTTAPMRTLHIMAATRSLYTHVGIVEIRPDGVPMVIEAAGPVRETGLNSWLKNGVADRVTVKRLDSLDPDEEAHIVAAAKTYLGKPYDNLYRFDKDKIYCSELIYDAFRDGAGLTLGKVQTVSELHADNPFVRRVIERLWRAHPDCKSQKADDFEACYKVIMKQKLITPAAVAADPRLRTVYSNYSPF